MVAFRFTHRHTKTHQLEGATETFFSTSKIILNVARTLFCCPAALKYILNVARTLFHRRATLKNCTHVAKTVLRRRRGEFCCFCMTVGKTKRVQKTSINSLSPHRRETAGTNPTCILRAGSAVSKYARAPGCGLCAGKYRRYEC